MKKTFCLILCVSLLLSGCSTMFDGYFSSVTPHTEKVVETEGRLKDADSYQDLCSFLSKMVGAYLSSGIISVANYNQANLVQDMREAIQYITTETPLGAYAVENISFNLGTNGGKAALAVEITYSKDNAQFSSIHDVTGMTAAQERIADCLSTFETGLLLHIQDFQPLDFSQWVADYCAAHPDIVIETPKVTVQSYPEHGTSRLIELSFHYQTARDSLREMQEDVRPIFDAATLYISEENDARIKYEKLFSFLIEFHLDSFPQQLVTSLTPAYSLLLHSVGDSRAIATVYAAMCRHAELECLTVSGAKAGQPWSWNIIRIGSVYYHLDLLASGEAKELRLLSDSQMQGYVWDYSAYPPCGVQPNT